MIKNLQVNEIVQTVSKTHLFDSDFLFAVNTSDVEDGKILNPPFLPVKELKGQFKKTIKNGDILFSEIRPANRHFAVVDVDNPKQYVVSTKLMVLRKYNDEVDSEYFYYWLTNTSFLNILQRRAENRICSFPQITFELLSEYSVPVPDIDTQKQIAKILKKIDSKISNNNAIITELESLAKTLYDYWFVQFDFPDKNGKPYKSSGGKMVWNEQLKREIPKGWNVSPLPKQCNIIDCLHSAKPVTNFESEDYYLLQLENLVEHGLINLENKYYVTRDMYQLWTSRIEVMEGDLVITNAGRVGSVARIPHNVKAGIGRNMTAIRPTNIPPCFLYYFITGRDADRQIKVNTDTGSFFGSLNVRGIKELLLTIPPKSLQTILDDFEHHVYPIRRKIEVCAQENFELTRLRDFLLPLLMNGQVVINE